MFLGQHSNRLPEFIQQGRGIDACGSDALTSVAGGHQGGSFRVVHRYPLQLTLQCFVKSACYQLASNHWPVASETYCYGGHSLLTNFYYPRERQCKCPQPVSPRLT